MAGDISVVLVNVTILHQLMEEVIMWDQIVKYIHVMKDAVQVHMHVLNCKCDKYVYSISRI